MFKILLNPVTMSAGLCVIVALPEIESVHNTVTSSNSIVHNIAKFLNSIYLKYCYIRACF